MWLSENQKFGAGFLASSLLFFLLGLTLFFDRACLSMANLLLLCGITLLMGPSRTLSFFLKKEKYQGTAFFFLGIVAILARWTIVGFILECYGLVRLFADFLGTILGFIGMVPVVGPVVERWGRRVTGSGPTLPV
ncbi:Got1 family protein [Pyronema domesticum]|uniref:Similar to Protein transport protein GOT1 acc. no. Q03554 n=1 Tax=Pyronema omphalodes (strain CBS 100304) TaxID=1076935 RepID=U4LPS9_PYROM|nr:Got1 family protein [Pyronema domesticum]CCX31320.1 Similar to Protein transport protein GOT1; acc. no. Q03554 [Pyronema omphalodes CBS 100304]